MKITLKTTSMFPTLAVAQGDYEMTKIGTFPSGKPIFGIERDGVTVQVNVDPVDFTQHPTTDRFFVVMDEGDTLGLAQALRNSGAADRSGPSVMVNVGGPYANPMKLEQAAVEALL